MQRASPGSAEDPLRVAVIGSGPSAFYATEALLKADGLHARVDVFDRLPTPYGLVRGGVAPDHQNIKNVVKVYRKIAEHEGFRFFGNVMIGRDVQVEDLTTHYHQIVWAVGNESDRRMGIDGEDLAGVHSATEFVGWYNGHPDFRDRSFDLKNATRVAVVGNGNVAMDVTRILVRNPDELADTDISDHALELLRESGVREVVLLGRRGPAQAAFSPKEIQEIANLDGVDLVVRPDEAKLDELSEHWVQDQPRSTHRNVQFLQTQAQKGEGEAARKVRCRFLISPVGLRGSDGRVTAVRCQRSVLHPDDSGTPRPKPVEEFEELEVQLVFKAIGYRGVPIPGMPYDDRRGIVPNDEGRVLSAAGGDPVPGQYVVGWAKRGPTGLIGTNSPDSKATVEHMLEDIATGKVESPAIERDFTDLLEERGIDFVNYQDWQRLDEWEVHEGRKRGKVRHKLDRVDEMMRVIGELRGG